MTATSISLPGIRSVLCDDTEILPDQNGVYVIPSSAGRIQITPSILDYTMTNPTVHVYLEGGGDDGITAEQSSLSALEYTRLRYGNYLLHIQILDMSTGEVLQDDAFSIIKKPRLLELLVVRILLLAMLAIAAGLIVWRIMTGTRQREPIRPSPDSWPICPMR